MLRLSEHLYYYEDCCNVYAIVNGDEAVLVDFGGGGILDCLHELGVRRVTAVLMTHHHRDQGQGLPRAIQAGAPVWVPQAEQDLFARVDEHWQARQIYNNYDVKQDRFSLLEPIPISGTLNDYREYRFGETLFRVLPTPGHTPGSITLLAEIDGLRVAFSGDLISAPGQVWSLAATQWTYNGAEGVAIGIPALLDLKAQQPDLLLPAHGAPMSEPAGAIDLLVQRFWQLLQARGQNLDLFDFLERPYEAITPHLLRSRANVAASYVLVSQSGKALMIDCGYDFCVHFEFGGPRYSRRPWLHSIPWLKEHFGIQQIEVVVPTHTHDDHVAGINLLREVEGAQVWAVEDFAEVLERPADYDFPCLWYDPIPVDRRLPCGAPIHWEEYTLTLHPLPGHSLYAAAIEFEVDGKRVLATGDQYQDDIGMRFNYVYQNRYRLGEYLASARLYRRLSPDLILPGHWQHQWVMPGFLDELVDRARELEDLLCDLSAGESAGLGEQGFTARLSPYQAAVQAGEPIRFQVELGNPFPVEQEALAQVIVPESWRAAPSDLRVVLPRMGSRLVNFTVTPPEGEPVRRARVAIDLTIGGKKYGQFAESLVTIITNPNKK
jgi:glyoxylase-like metal-dependent hydrolase (beta-lactamase superfamily II)